MREPGHQKEVEGQVGGPGAGAESAQGIQHLSDFG